MQFEFQNIIFHFPPLIILAAFIAIFYFLYKWSKELENRRLTIFLYFLISTHISPLYTRYTEKDGLFELWFPLGFVFALVYMYANKKIHPAKMKASLLGFAIAMYNLIREYAEFLL